MATLTVENVPDDLYERLQDRARRHRRAVDREVIDCLEKALMPPFRSAEEAIAEAEALNRKIVRRSMTISSNRASERGVLDMIVVDNDVISYF